MTIIERDVLAAVDPHYRSHSLAEAWSRTLNDYREWTQAHGRAPQPGDDGAAGLAGWLADQNPAALTRHQRQQLETLHGYTHGLDRPAAALLAALRDAGAALNDAQPAITDLPPAPHAPAAMRELARCPGYLAAAIHTVRYCRQPEHPEAGAQWRRSVPPSLLGAAQQFLDDATDPSAPRLSVARAAHSYERWAHLNAHKPRATSSDALERRIAAWRARIRRMSRQGQLNAAEQTLAAAALD